MDRTEIYKIIDAEREYQEKRWGASGKGKPTESYMVYMKTYIDHAFNAITAGNEAMALHVLRKAVALGVACFEDNGVPRRSDSTPAE